MFFFLYFLLPGTLSRTFLKGAVQVVVFYYCAVFGSNDDNLLKCIWSHFLQLFKKTGIMVRNTGALLSQCLKCRGREVEHHLFFSAPPNSLTNTLRGRSNHLVPLDSPLISIQTMPSVHQIR